MNRLFAANLLRLKRNKLFWGLNIAMAVIPTVMIFQRLIFSDSRSIDGIMFMYPIFIGIAVPIFISIFFGTEYSDGTIRNKLTIGHGRPIVYLANLLTALAAACVMFAAYMIPVIVFGFTIFDMPAMSGELCVSIISVSLTTIAAFCALHTMVSMIYDSKSGASVVNLLLAFILLVAALMILSKLNAPKYVSYHDIGGGIKYMLNPSYLMGGARYFCRAIVDILPMGQATQIAFGGVDTLWILAVCSILVTAICTLTGITVFDKKNIK